MNNRRKKKNYYFLFFVLIFLIVSIFSYSYRRLSFAEKFVKDTSIFILEIFAAPINYIINENIYNYSEDVNSRILELEYQIAKMEEDFEIDSNLINFEKINSIIINRNTGIWFDGATINKGSNDGVSDGDAVIINNTLVGIVEKTSYLNSEISFITSEHRQSKISVKVLIGDEYEYGVLVNYDSKKNLFVLEGYDDDLDIEAGSIVVTTGFTNNYPPGLLIGMVDSVDLDNFGLSKIVNVKPAIDYNKIRYVTVLGEQ